MLLLRSLLTALALMLSVVGAQAQTNPLGSGFNFVNGTLYVPNISVMSLMVAPFGYSYNISTTAAAPGTSFSMINSSPAVSDRGFTSQFLTGGVDSYHFKNFLPSSSSSGNSEGSNCNRPSCMMYRWPQLTDGNLHNVCVFWNVDGTGNVYVDGLLKDHAYNPSPYVPSPETWQLGQNPVAVTTMWDLRVYGRAVTPTDCVSLANSALNGVYPTTGSLNTGMVLHLPLDNCVLTSGVWSCADTSGNGNTALTASTVPGTTVLTAPAAGTISGDVTMTATCTQLVGSCAKVCYLVDGSLISNKLLTVTGAGAGASGRVRLTVNNVLQSTTADSVIVAGVLGTTEANGTFTINVIDSTHIDLIGTTFTNAYVSGGTVNDTSQLCPSVAPYTLTWATASQLIDGTHSLAAVGYDVSNLATNSAAVSVTASNGTVAKNYYFSPSGDDTHTCLSPAQACKTFAKMTTFSYLGGDTVNFDGSNTANAFTDTTGFKLCVANSAATPINCSPQNYYPSNLTLTFTSYNAGTCNVFTTVLPTITSPSAFALPANCAVIKRTGGGTPSMFTLANASNVTIQNLSIIGPNTSSFDQSTCGVGAAVRMCTGLASLSGGMTNVTIQNNFAYGWGSEINANQFWATSATNTHLVGTMTNLQILDNVISGPYKAAAGSSPVQGITTGSATQSIVQGNLLTNMGGDGGNGGAMTMYTYPSPSAGATPTLVQFNVSHDDGGNWGGGQGGPYDYLAFNTEFITYQFNEQYSYHCWYGAGYPACLATYGGVDGGGIDMDGSSSNAIIQYNYIHDDTNNVLKNGFQNNAFGVVWCITHWPFGTPNPNWGPNVARYNILENNAQGLGVCAGLPGVVASFYNNTVVGNGSRTDSANPEGTFGVCWLPVGTIVNNLCIQTANTGVADFAIWNGSGCPAVNGLDYNYYWGAGTATNVWKRTFSLNSTTLTAWQNVIGANCANRWEAHSFGPPTVSNPLLTGTPGTMGACYSDTSGVAPTGPQACNATNPYVLQHGSPLIGTGVDVFAAYNQFANPPRDFLGNTVPNGVGSGWNIGADGGAHP